MTISPRRSWLIESAGTLPINRAKESNGQPVDNHVVFKTLIEALEVGDCICMFPSGFSAYRAELPPLKTGVARIVSDVLSRQRDNPEFELAIQTCSITYLHRNLFRSDVLVTYHKPLRVSAKTHPGLVGTPESAADYAAVRELTSTMAEAIRAGTLDAPSWEFIRLANTARRLYAPLGTRLSLGEHVRLTQRFVDCFAHKRRSVPEGDAPAPTDLKDALDTPMLERDHGLQLSTQEKAEVDELARDLQTYQDLLYLHGIKDDRIRNPALLRRRTLWKRLAVRFGGASFLFLISVPGLVLWAPVFVVCKRQTEKLKKSGPVFE